MRAQNAAMNEMRQITESHKRASSESSQTISQPMQNPGPEESSDPTNGSEIVSSYRESSVPSTDVEVNRSTGPDQRRCYNCDAYGHFSRYCKKTRSRDENVTSPRNVGSDRGRIQQESADPFLEL